MLKKIGIGLLAVLLVIVGLAMTKPDNFAIERTATINAPPEKIFPLINDFHQWPAWSPWEKLDTAMARTYSGADSGVGAVYEWKGNSDVGSGRMEITESTAPGSMVMKLDFLEPFEAHNITEFVLTPSGNGTTVRWNMHGPSNFMTKVMGVFVSMDRMVGPDFQRGLDNLKMQAEK